MRETITAWCHPMSLILIQTYLGGKCDLFLGLTEEMQLHAGGMGPIGSVGKTDPLNEQHLVVCAFTEG